MGDWEEIPPTDAKLIRAAVKDRKEEVVFLGNFETPDKKKPENRVIIVGKYRVFEFKKGGKLTQHAHLLDLQDIISPSSNDVKLKFKTATLHCITPKADAIINGIRFSFASSFAGMPEQDRFSLNVAPPSRIQEIPNIQDKTLDGYATTYKSLCDYYTVQVREDIAWDLQNLFPVSNIKDFNLREFEQPLTPGDLKCLLGALRYNNWFHSLMGDGFVFTKETYTDLGLLLKGNSHIQDLILPSSSLSKDALIKMAEGIAANPRIGVLRYDLHDNPIEDKGLTAFSQAIEKQPIGLVSLNLSSCNLGKSGLASLGQALLRNTLNAASLTELNLSHNKLEPEGSASLAAFLARPNALRKLCLTSSSPNLEVVLAGIVRGCNQMISLDISGNKLGSKELGHIAKYLQASSSLKELILNNTDLKAAESKEMMRALASNPYLNNFCLGLAENHFSTVDAGILAPLISQAGNIAELDVSDNDFGDEGVTSLIESLCDSPSLRTLKIGRSWSVKIDPNQRSICIESLITLISSDCPLRALSIDGSPKAQLKTDLVPFLNALGTNNSLTFLDITGNQMGARGAIALGKAIQTNQSLTTLWWDENLTNMQGFLAFQMGLERNRVLKEMPLPVLDIGLVLKSEPPQRAKAIQTTLLQIQNALGRNQAPRSPFDSSSSGGSSGDDGTARSLGQLKILNSGEREKIERLRFKIKSMGRTLTPAQQDAVADADANDSVLSSLHFLAEEVLDTTTQLLQEQLRAICTSTILPIYSQQRSELISRSLTLIQEKYKSLDSDVIRRLRINISLGAKDLEASTVEKILADIAGAELSQKANETILSTIQLATDYIFEKLSDQLVAVLEDIQQVTAPTPSSSTPLASSSSGSGSALNMVREGIATMRKSKKDDQPKVQASSAPSTPLVTPPPKEEKVDKPEKAGLTPARAPPPVPSRAAYGTLKPVASAPMYGKEEKEEVDDDDLKSSGSRPLPSRPAPPSRGGLPTPPVLPQRSQSPAHVSVPVKNLATSSPSVPASAPNEESEVVRTPPPKKLAADRLQGINIAALAPGGTPPVSRPKTGQPRPLPSAGSAPSTPSESKPIPKRPPIKVVPKKAAPPKKAAAPPKGAAGSIGGGDIDVSDVPMVESNITNHMTRDRPAAAGKRRPPTRRPRGPQDG
eukprot:TRINITY_DN599_c0_g2_i1.p1 TRINITY_DN599_c0_g2~~TRINITY_DN599_c0_g2_i1.p1  ORF type:complete len:1159 (-),score=276.83 TRINITY_DN599_c0_g2_i1:134-3610(-)